MASIHLPDWLYEAKPALYALGGATFAVCVPSLMGRASGVLLVAAGLVIRTVRKRHRAREANALLERLSTFEAPPSRLAETTAFVRAVAPPKLGHADIDRQHRGLAAQCATLHIAFEHRDNPADLDLLLGDLVDALAAHFETEDTAMRRLGVSRAEALHAADLRAFNEAQRTLAACRRGETTLEDAIRDITQKAVAAHLKSAHPPLPSMEAALEKLRAMNDDPARSAPHPQGAQAG